jgi:hypothetical protein
VHTLGVDETGFLAATATRHTVYAAGIVALNGRPRLLAVIRGRSGSALSAWVSGRDQAWRDGIEVAALDPFRGYATALHATLPAGVWVLDAFHVVKLGFDAVDQVRRRVQHDTTGHRGRKHDPLYAIRRLLRRGHDRHSAQLSTARRLTNARTPDGSDDRPGARFALVVHRVTKRRCQRRIVAGVTSIPTRRGRGSHTASAAITARSVHNNRGRPTWRCKTAS